VCQCSALRTRLGLGHIVETFPTHLVLGLEEL
jgi:hypothetical protein